MGTRILLFAIAVLLVGCGRGVGSGDAVPDGSWELVQLDFDEVSFQEPLLLTSSNELFGVRGACNSLGQEPNGDIVQILVGCEEPLERIDEALIDVMQGERQLNGDELVLRGEFAVARLRSIVLATPAELFSVLGSSEPNIDPSTLLLDSEAGGPPQDWDRMLRVDADVDLAEFVIGSSQGSVCFHVGLDTERVTSGSGCMLAHDLRENTLTMLVGYPDPRLQAALIPDAFLTDEGLAILEEAGAVYGNVFVVQDGSAVDVLLVDETGNELPVTMPSF